MEAASCIIAVLQITGTVINLCYHYRKGVKSASKDIARITTELKTLMTVLEQLLQLAENDDRLKNAKGLCEPGGPLCDCRALMEELQKKLEPEDGFRAAIVRAAMWPLREAELEKTLVRIGSFKQTFSLALGGDQARMILKVDDGVTDLTKSFESERFGGCPCSAPQVSATAEHRHACFSQRTRRDLRMASGARSIRKS